jgi:uncharacterized membrane protein
MDRNEFLRLLEEALRGEIPDGEIPEHIRYYDSYIRENNGKTEEEKLRELGDPRLIARTIIDATMTKEGYTTYTHPQGREYEEEETREDKNFQKNYRVYTWEGLHWYQKLLVGFVILMVLLLIFAAVVISLKILLISVPILLLAFFICWLITLLKTFL